MTDAPTTHELTRCHRLPVGKEDERCDGCGMVIAGGLLAEYRLDGSLFCTVRCAATHSGLPLETKVTA